MPSGGVCLVINLLPIMALQRPATTLGSLVRCTPPLRANISRHTQAERDKQSHLEAIVKVPLASASSQNLSLDHILLTWESFGDLLSL